MLIPKLVTSLKGYTLRQFASDLGAGVVVGIVAIPLAVAFAIASGVSPEKGLFTAIVAGFLISALGGSRVQIGGPTGAFVVIVYGIVQRYGIDGLILATLMAGIMLVILGFIRAGFFIKYIPHTVIVGFTSGIAVVIFSSQIKDLLGLETGALPADFIDKCRVLLEHSHTFNPYALAMAAVSILIITQWPRVSRVVPGPLVALVACSALAAFARWPLETIGSRFGELPHTLPVPHWPALDLETARRLLRPAFTIAMLGAIESLLSAVVADGMIGGKHRSNMELIAQGAANIGSALFGGMPATGAIARTVTNIKNGGRTPVAGIVHAATVFAALLFLGRWIRLVPLACLAGILTVVAYHMSEWRTFRGLIVSSKGAAVILTATFLLTILIDLTVAIEAGLVLSGILFVKRMAGTSGVRLIAREMVNEERAEKSPLAAIQLPQDVEVYEVNGPLFFGTANQFEEAARAIADKPKVRILRLRNVPFMDSTGLKALKSFYHNSKHSGIALIISGLHVQPLNEMIKADLYDLVGADNVCANIDDALTRARQLLPVNKVNQ